MSSNKKPQTAKCSVPQIKLRQICMLQSPRPTASSLAYNSHISKALSEYMIKRMHNSAWHVVFITILIAALVCFHALCLQ